jgi:hypothetical protein
MKKTFLIQITSGSSNVESIEEWLGKKLNPGQKVGQFSRFTSISI